MATPARHDDAAVMDRELGCAEIRKIMNQAEEGGGFVLMPTAAPINLPLSPKTEANYKAFITAGLELGHY